MTDKREKQQDTRTGVQKDKPKGSCSSGVNWAEHFMQRFMRKG
jgi:hypothetical protein